MPRRKTDKEFKQEVYDLVGDEYEFLDTYVNTMTKLRVKHHRCGQIYEVKPNNFLTGYRCPYCFGNVKKTNAKFKQEVKNLVGNEYTFLDPYVNTKTKLRIKHNTCGNVYEVRPNDFLRGNRCPYCSGKLKKTNAQFQQEVKNLVEGEYIFLDSYVNRNTKIKVKHNKCGNIYKVRPTDFINGHRCPYCSGNPKKTDVRFKQEVRNLVDNEYTFIDTYTNAQTKIRVKHNKCGNIYKVRPTDFLDHQTRCPYCNMPKTEKMIARILETFSINYEIQKTFDDLEDDNYLSYDFYIPDKAILIEYQGKQHYQPIELYGGENQFKVQQKHDKMKADYAKDHNYKLIAVPYTEDTFSKIKKYLIKHGLS